MIEARRMVHCETCTLEYDVSGRTYRDIKAGRIEPRCALHRGTLRQDNTKIAQFRRYWLDRFTLDQIIEMGSAIESYMERGAMIGPALTASAAPGPAELGGNPPDRRN